MPELNLAPCITLMLLGALQTVMAQPRLVVEGGRTEYSCGTAALAPDSRLAVTADEGVATLWDVKSGRELRRFSGHVPKIEYLSFGLGGNSVLVGATGSSGSIQWDTHSGTAVHRFHPSDGAPEDQGMSLAVFSPDASVVFVSGNKNEPSLLLESRSLQELWRLPIADGEREVARVAFSADSRYVAVYRYDAIRIWDVQSRKEYRRLPDLGEVTDIALSRSGVFIAVSLGYTRPAIRVWRLDSLREVANYSGFTSPLAFSPSKDSLVTIRDANDREDLYVWDGAAAAAPPRKMAEIPDLRDQHGGRFLCGLSFSHNGRDLLVNTRTGAVLLDPQTGNERRRFEGHARLPSSIALSSTGDQAVVGDSAGWVHLWNLRTGRLERSLQLHKGEIRATEFLPGNRRFLSAADDGVVRITDWRTASSSITAKTGPARGGAVSPDGLTFMVTTLTSYANRRTTDESCWWKLGETVPLKCFVGDDPPYRSPFTSVAFSPNGNWFAAGSWDHSVWVWDAKTGREVARLTGHSGWVKSVAFSQDSRLIFTGSTATARVWQTGTWQPVWTEEDTFHTLNTAAFSVDGKWIASGNNLGGVYLIDARHPESHFLLSGHDNAVNAVAFTPNGRFLLSAADDATVRIWDLLNRKEVVRLISFPKEGWVAISPDGRFDTKSLDDQALLHWVMPDDALRPLPIELFMRDYFEPHVLPRLLAHEQFRPLRPLTTLNRAQPRVSILSITPEPGRSDEVSVTVGVAAGEYRFRRNNESVVNRTGAYDLRLFRDGQLVAQFPNSPDALRSEPQSGDVSLASLKAWQTAHAVPLKNRTFHNIRLAHSATGRLVEFTAYAFNSDRVKSETARRAYTSPTLSYAKPRAYVITMGVSAYQDSNWDLWFAAEGAKQMRDFVGRVLNDQKRYEVVPITLLAEYEEHTANIKEKTATKAALKHVIDSLAGRRHEPSGKIGPATPDDLVFLYISSHGYAAPDGHFYVIPFDIGASTGVTEKVLNRALTRMLPQEQIPIATAVLERSISSDELSAWLHDVDAGQMILVLDSCHSAEVTGRNFKPGPMGDRGFGQLAYDKRMRVLVATQADNIAIGPKTLNQSLLTYSLLHPAVLTFNFRDWLAQTEEQVPDLYRRYYPEGKAQEPVFFDFSRSAGKER